MTNPEQEPIIKLSDQETEDLLSLLEGDEENKPRPKIGKKETDEFMDLLEEEDSTSKKPDFIDHGANGDSRNLTENEIDDILLSGLEETEKPKISNKERWAKMSEQEKRKIVLKAYSKLSDIEKKFVTSASNEKFQSVMSQFKNQSKKVALITGIRNYFEANKIQLEQAA